jgi:transcriptional regulator with XRE-family HTH domain
LIEEGTDILQENIRHLLASLEHGQKSALAQAIGVHGTTVSDWQRGTYPTPEHRTKLLRYFHIDPGSTLEATPLFLEPFPALDRERRAWLQQRIAELDETTLRALFPALERLFGKS